MRGLIYLHDSPIRAHGRLHSANCVIDSRFDQSETKKNLQGFRRCFGGFKRCLARHVARICHSCLANLLSGSGCWIFHADVDVLPADRVSASKKMSFYVSCGFVKVFSGRPQHLIY